MKINSYTPTDWRKILDEMEEWFKSPDYQKVLSDLIVNGISCIKFRPDPFYHRAVVLGLEHGVYFDDEAIDFNKGIL